MAFLGLPRPSSAFLGHKRPRIKNPSADEARGAIGNAYWDASRLAARVPKAFARERARALRAGLFVIPARICARSRWENR